MDTFRVDNLCRGCMEPYKNVPALLFNKKKKKKTQICVNFEDLCLLKVKEDDQLPQQLCMECVSELNKCFAFKEKCVRTYQTLISFLGLSDDEEDEQEQVQKQSNLPPIIESEREEVYEEIEVTQDLLEQAKKQNEGTSDMMLAMDEFTNILGSQSNVKIQEESDDGLVFIIQSVAGSDQNVRSPEVQKQVPTSDAKGSHQCSICELTFVRQKNFHNHFKRFHADVKNDEPVVKRIRLTLTNNEKPDVEDAKLKLQENPDAKKCKTCGALYMNEKSLKLHEKRNTCNQQTYECSQCQKVFINQDLFREHTENHPQNIRPEESDAPDPAKKFHCTYEGCSKSFKMSSTLKDHLRTHSNEKPYVCKLCGRGFSQNTNLKQHLRRHTQVKPFVCQHPGCTSSFVSKGELDSHLRKHSGDHPFKCEQCESSFTTSSSLVKHRRIHSGERPYSCEFCPMRFTALGTLKNHIKTHTGEKDHKCKYCARAFTQKSDLTSHERTHTGERPYKCTICNCCFNQSGTLKTHMKVHNNATSENE